MIHRVSRRSLIKGAAGAALLGGVGMPAISRAQSDVIRIGHLTPLTGFLGPVGEYAVMGVKLAAEEVNAAGGIMGRKVELVLEDSVNPQTASSKAERLVERDKVSMIIGEISSASGLAIGQVANRLKTVFINTGCNSDALRGANCNPFMFHIEAANSMYVETAGNYFLRENLVKGKKWFTLTADYAFGHDLSRVARGFLQKHGGTLVGDELVPTDATDFSPYLLKIRQARPDVVASNLAGNQITNFIKQYAEYGLPFPIGGFGFDTVVAWGAGKGNFAGIWPLPWHHLVDTPSSRKFVEAFTKKYGKPPENQSWGDYHAFKLTAQAMNEMKSNESVKLSEHLRKGAKFDIGKSREGYFRPYDNQMIMEMYAVRAKEASKQKDQWDIYEALGTVPAPGEDLEVLAPPKDGACKMPA
ncbi:leucine-specific-binding protein precursor [Variibacter gotjawalensis]|uniref:Leucine-specific-binding protein n=1 Tax=Variibacter gotjawalensis TaxID=1333996 RepID=A0A0S3Q0K8_9BRAD|nr:ABC transporter substrate-binding protein [Variibacter gotjawalensis]NIK47538.1 branched-chain amino acid transport system substrate-binding protein [Variibacter gotjawalensis]RZS49435.1 amino acid/amide ABC transporter substrate-binding protein (HAAT family) [Variibacter gotjawalensis]BAT61698.1 leucine-specific-binding protein precursor [Variibacter gotjawalensis]